MSQKKQIIKCRKCHSKRAELSPAYGFETLIVWFLPFSPYRCLFCYKRYWFWKKVQSHKSYYSALLFLTGILVTLNINPHWMPKFKVDQAIDSQTNTQSSANNSEISVASISSEVQNVVLDADEQRELVENLAFNEPDKVMQTDSLLKIAELADEPAREQPIEQKVAEQSGQFNTELQQTIQVDPQEIRSLLKVDINYLIEQWRQAWQSGDSETYLGFYSPQFIPAGDVALSSWQQNRKVRVVPSKKISLQLSNFDVTLDELNQKSVVSFDQQYQSSTYSEKSRKQLTLVRENEWRIVAEKTVE